MGENAMPSKPEPEVKNHSISFYIILGASLIAFINTFSLLAPILLSFLLILLISLAVNPMISRIRTLTGGRKGAAGLLVAALVVFIVLTGWAFFGPMKTSIINLSAELPGYWERFQKPLIKMEQKAVLSEKKLQAEVTTEIAKIEASEGRPVVAAKTTKSAPPETTKASESIRSRLSEMLQGVVGSFTAMAFNAGQMLVVLVTVFFGVCFTLMNPRPMHWKFRAKLGWDNAGGDGDDRPASFFDHVADLRIHGLAGSGVDSRNHGGCSLSGSDPQRSTSTVARPRHRRHDPDMGIVSLHRGPGFGK